MATIETRDGIFLEIPEGMAPDAPEVKEAVNAERVGRRRRRMDEPDFKAKVEAERARGRETYDPTKDMGVGTKTLANYGAGVDSFLQGLKQVVGTGAPDAEIREKRQRDAALARSTDTGMLPDWVPTAGSALQFAGENSAALIPGGIAGRAGTKALPVLAKTLGRRAVAEGAIGGGVMGALQPTTSDESRSTNVTIGAGAGAALPLAISGGRMAKDLYTGAGARRAAAERLGVTPETPLPADPAALATPGAERVPLSTAATYGDDALAAQELSSRARQSPEWAGFDRAQNRALWENVEQGTQRAGTESGLRLERQGLWKTREAQAMAAVKPKVWAKEMPQLRQNLEQALRSPQGQNEMRPVLNEIIRQMDDLGPEFSPQHLAALRSRMAGRVRGSPTDPFTSAPMSDPAYISLRREMDDILNATTGDKWGKVVEGYREASVPVAQAKAETGVKGRFMTPEGMPRTTASEPGVPTVTENALRQAVTKPQVANVRGTAPTFAPESERVLKGTLAAIERQNILQSAKKTATGGGGSMTQPLAQAATAMDPTGLAKYVNMALRIANGVGDRRALAELDQALIDPQRYYALVEETIKAGKPLTVAQQIAMKALQGGAVGGAEQALQQPQQPQLQQQMR